MFVDLTERNTQPLESDRLLQEERDEINSRQSSRSSQFNVVDFVFDYGLLMILLVIVAAIYFGALHLT